MSQRAGVNNPVGKALWFIESHFAEPLTLDGVAQIGGVSRYHMTRAFEAATGHPVMRYLRARRLTEAARALAGGAPDILAVALEAGYGSHEAFTRAFREQFGLTPEALRTTGALDNLALMEPITMDQTLLARLETPRFESFGALLLAGLKERYDCDSSAAIPSQWQRFTPHIGNIPGEVGRIAYGVACNHDEAGNFDYLTAVEVRDFSGLPPELARLRLAPQRYAVFTHRDHVSEVRRSMATIWTKWLPESGHEAADAPFFERYGGGFDPRTGMGGFEVWLPLKA